MDQKPTPQNPSDADELAALIEAGGFWRLAPDWVPRGGYAGPSRDVLKGVEAGLQRRLAR